LEVAQVTHRQYPLTTQMRVRAGADYVEFIRRMLRGDAQEGARPDFGEYDLRFFDDVGVMRDAIFAQDRGRGLARLVAGYAWDWVSKKDLDAYDIVLDGVSMRWNSKDTDWINSPRSLHEVGSIHTVQGYDLNYAGVIIGPDLRYDPISQQLFVERDSYRDRKGSENNPRLGIAFSDADLLQYIRNIYGVLLTRGMLGTFVYVCDPALRAYVRSRLR
jgi:DUF2075 family protein